MWNNDLIGTESVLATHTVLEQKVENLYHLQENKVKVDEKKIDLRQFCAQCSLM